MVPPWRMERRLVCCFVISSSKVTEPEVAAVSLSWEASFRDCLDRLDPCVLG